MLQAGSGAPEQSGAPLRGVGKPPGVQERGGVLPRRSATEFEVRSSTQTSDSESGSYSGSKSTLRSSAGGAHELVGSAPGAPLPHSAIRYRSKSLSRKGGGSGGSGSSGSASAGGEFAA